MAQAPRKSAAKAARPPVSQRTPLLEWIAAGIGLVLAVAVIAVIGKAAISPAGSAPSIAVNTEGVERAGQGYVLTLTARNLGGRPAAQVVVEGELSSGGDTETVETTFDYIPGQSSRRGGLFFEGDPRQGQLKIRAKGFVEP